MKRVPKIVPMKPWYGWCLVDNKTGLRRSPACRQQTALKVLRDMQAKPQNDFSLQYVLVTPVERKGGKK
jgi:hypothetical protein